MIRSKWSGAVGQDGFTISEVSIATSVFAVVLLVALVSFFGISKLFYKGVSVTRTQEVASNILSDVQGDFRNAASVSILNSNNGYKYYCIGDSRYTINVGPKIDLNAATNHAPSGNYGILKDSIPSGSCPVPCDDSFPVCSGQRFNNTTTELLGQNMRVAQFDIQTLPNTSLFTVTITVAYGDDDLFDYTNPANPSTISCKGAAADQYCSVARVSTSVVKEGT
jgi:prepilin-type N-terminal cleavage/methylation domain-containing protein